MRSHDQRMKSHDHHVMLTLLRVDLSEAVVAHLVHEAVEENGRAFLVHSELSLGSEVVGFLDVAALLCAASNPYHPQELVDVCRERGREGNERKRELRERPSEAYPVSPPKITNT